MTEVQGRPEDLPDGVTSDPPVEAWPLTRHSALWLGVTLAAGLAMRIDRLGGRSYWFDEGFSWKIITFSWREMIERVAMDNHGPLYFILLKLWANAFGDSPWSLRFLSVLMGELTILGTYLFAREAFRDGLTSQGGTDWANAIGLLAAILVAVSTFQIQWACEVRMYTLGTALTAFSGWLLLRTLCRREHRRRWWLAYTLVTTLFAYTHPYALFSIAAQAIFAFGYVAAGNRWRLGAVLRDARLRTLILSYGLVFLLWTPWLPVLMAQRRQVGESFWLPPMSLWLIIKTCYQMFAPSQYDVPSVGAAIAAATACTAGFAALLWHGGRGDWFVALTGLVPVALSVSLSFLQFNIFHRHYFLFAHISFLVMIAVLIGRVRVRQARRAVAAAVLLGFLGIYSAFARERTARAAVPGAQAAAAFLDDRRAPGELAVVCSPMLTPSMEGHSRQPVGWRTYKMSGEYPHYMGTAITRSGEYITAEDLEKLTGDRAWVIDVERWEKEAPTVSVPQSWVRQGEWRFPEIYGKGCEIIVREYKISPSGGRQGPR